MIYKISKPEKSLKGTVILPSSKSLSNRALIIKALCNDPFEIKNLSLSEDTMILKKILDSEVKHLPSIISHDVGEAGTAMRFLTAYFSIKPGIRILTGSNRMKQRPVKILVEALKKLGARIEYLEKDGFPPLKIEGAELNGKTIEIEGNISSQYTSAIMLIAPYIKNGFTIRFKGGVITSTPYIKMTAKIMERFGVKVAFEKDHLSVIPQEYKTNILNNAIYEIEKDWSSASYWYEMAALSEETDLTLIGLNNNSIQGDAMLPSLFSFFGIKTTFIDNGIHLTKIKNSTKHFAFHFADYPDLAQTIAVTASALNIPYFLNGLATLKIKETDRIDALKSELKKIGITAHEKYPGSLETTPASSFHLPSSAISTYGDHRMAMAFAPLAIIGKISIENPEVVNKSYPDFWKDLKSVGFEITEE